MIVKAEAGRTGIITATDDDGRMTQILLDDQGNVHRVTTVTYNVPAGVNGSSGHVVEIVMNYPPATIQPIPLRVLVDPA